MRTMHRSLRNNQGSLHMALDMVEDSSIRKACFFTPLQLPANRIWDSVLIVWALT